MTVGLPARADGASRPADLSVVILDLVLAK